VTSGSAETQPERTALSWQRTGLGVLGVGGLLAHRALEHGSAVQLVVAGVAGLVGLGLLGGLGPVRYRQVRRGMPGSVAAPRLLAAATGAVVLVAVAAGVAVLPPR
jgi:putative membrane protein